ncbi:hypothetical protein SynRS9902_01085 [Synechococcus sp. RS9902]|nr:hypothetical protein SynRS9902_01085 [Synechococcus sp. RS9902]
MDPKRTCSWLVANDTVLESDGSDGAKIRFSYQNCFARFHPFFHIKKRRFPQAEVGSPAVTVNL